MSTKKMTKKQKRENELKQALQSRVEDIASGVTAGDTATDDPDYWFGADELSRLVPAVRKSIIGYDDDGKEIKPYLTVIGNLEHYENCLKITDFLFDHGVRA